MPRLSLEQVSVRSYVHRVWPRSYCQGEPNQPQQHLETTNLNYAIPSSLEHGISDILGSVGLPS